MSNSNPKYKSFDEMKEIYGDLSKTALSLLYSLTDPDPCSFDHNHSCQAHGYFYLDQGDLCPNYEAQLILIKAKDAGVVDWELPYSQVVIND